jgi:formiminotetrahydrofolate cyclodeaminase
VAADAAGIASRLAEQGNPNLRGDAVIAVLLADAAARGAAVLVEINVALGRLEGDWIERSTACLATAADAVRNLDPSSKR